MSSGSVQDAEGFDIIPEAAVHYVIHTELGRSLRDIARETGCHASTVLRRVRRCENRRDDPLVDGAFDRLSAAGTPGSNVPCTTEDSRTMTATIQAQFGGADPKDLSAGALRALRRLAETGAILAVAKELDKAVVVRELPGGRSTQTTVIDREVAELMALNEWISGSVAGRVARYSITSVGRAALKRMLSETGTESVDGMAEAAQPFAAQHRDWESRAEPGGGGRRIKYNLAESPLTALARRRDKSGEPFLSDELVAAGERLREDFELAQMGPRITQNWDSFLTGPRPNGSRMQGSRSDSAQEARDRVHSALADLGPGLGDVVLRCCCFLEGIETTEKTMGWSARSGKVVLRIALQRLRRHYEERNGKFAPMIG
ncbi:MAG: helix-turn-helix domain-containing protein [Rhodobacteraceae bacterium]|nr:helix-turn-helix domain-containing protein [Paracoccaceae bacterium]